MKTEKAKDYAIIVIAVFFTASTAYSMYQSYVFMSSSSANPVGSLSVYASCSQSIDTGITIASVDLDNYSEKEVRNIRCSVVDNGGLTLASGSPDIDSIASQSSDVCYFEFSEGDFVHPVKFGVTYESGSAATICQPY